MGTDPCQYVEVLEHQTLVGILQQLPQAGVQGMEQFQSCAFIVHARKPFHMVHEQDLHVVGPLALAKEALGGPDDVLEQLVVPEFVVDDQVEEPGIGEDVLPEGRLIVIKDLVQPEQRLVHLACPEMDHGERMMELDLVFLMQPGTQFVHALQQRPHQLERSAVLTHPVQEAQFT